jgi:hypothetical protein
VQPGGPERLVPCLDRLDNLSGAVLQLSGYEPVAGEHITGIEWTLNGETFAVQNSASVTIPALEGQSDFQYWAHSSFPDTSLMGASTLYLDSQSPLVSASSLVGTLGDNGWYISDVGISVSFSDPAPGSGLDGVFYLLNGGAPQPFASPLTLTDGQHEVRIRAADLAGNLSELSQTIKVDTIPPNLEDALEGTLFDGWYAKTAILSASASDAGSGLAGLDVSLDGGGWTAYTVPLVIGDGQHQAVFRARDLAGNLSLTAPLTFKVDATGPKIDLPERWNIWDTAAFVVRDGGSGLSSVEVILSDPQGRWPQVTRTYAPTGSRYDGQIGWNRRFADDTLAPEGEYRVTVKASDLAGNFSQEEATLAIPVAGDSPREETIIQPEVEVEDPPLETIFTLPPEEPKAVSEPVESVFGGTSLAALNEAWQADSLASAPPLAEPPGILWGASALAAMAAMTAYYEQKRREEEEAQRAAVHAQASAKNAAIEAKREAYWEQVKTQNYLQGKAMLEAALKDPNLSDEEKAAIRAQAQAEGMSAGLNLTAATVAAHQQAKREADIAWLEQAEETEQDRHEKHINSEKYAAYQADLLAWHVDQEKKKQAEEDERKKQAEYATNQAYAALRVEQIRKEYAGDPNYYGLRLMDGIVAKEGSIISIYALAGIGVQNPNLARPVWLSRLLGKHTGVGPAKISDASMETEYGAPVYDDAGRHRGDGLGLRALGEQNPDQADKTIAMAAMIQRIQLAVDACDKMCTSTDIFNVAALAQNGPGFLKNEVRDLVKGIHGERIPDGSVSIPWHNYLLTVEKNNPDNAAYHKDMIRQFANNVSFLKDEGYNVPDDLDWKYIYLNFARNSGEMNG